jgi:hypothetical protein
MSSISPVGVVYSQFTAGNTVSVPAASQARAITSTTMIPFTPYQVCKGENLYLSISASDNEGMTIIAAAVFLVASDGQGNTILDVPLPLPGNFLSQPLPHSDILRIAAIGSCWLSTNDQYQAVGSNPVATSVNIEAIVVLANPDVSNAHAFKLNVGGILRFLPYANNDVLAGSTVHTTPAPRTPR